MTTNHPVVARIGFSSRRAQLVGSLVLGLVTACGSVALDPLGNQGTSASAASAVTGSQANLPRGSGALTPLTTPASMHLADLASKRSVAHPHHAAPSPSKPASTIRPAISATSPSFTANSFTAASGGAVVAMAVGDLNNDGFPDIVSAEKGSSGGHVVGYVYLYLNNRSGGFSAGSLVYTSPLDDFVIGVALGDMNNDGKPDIVALTQAGLVVLLTNQGSGAFSGPTAIVTGPGQCDAGQSCGFTSLALGDMNNDGNVDVILGSGGGSNSADYIYVYYGSGGASYPLTVSASLRSPRGGPTTWTYYSQVIAADLEGNGNLDIVGDNGGCGSGGGIDVWHNNGSGSFTAPGNQPQPQCVGPVTIADVNGDGIEDLVAQRGNGGGACSGAGGTCIEVWLGQGGGNFGPVTYGTSSVTGNVPSIAVGDFNLDGTPDVALTDKVGSAIDTYIGTGSSPYFANTPTATSVPGAPTVVITADVNLNHKPDLIVADGSSITVLTNGTSFPPGLAGSAITTGELLGVNNPAEPHLRSCNCADPVNTLTGNFSETLNELGVPGRGMALNFSESYNSLVASAGGAADNGFGYGWTSSYQMSLAVTGTSPNQVATISQENGSQVSFNQPSSGSVWTPSAPRIEATLSLVANVWTLTRDATQTFTFDNLNSGRMTSESDLNGYVTTLAYGGGACTSTQLCTITEDARAGGRVLALTWAGGDISSVAIKVGGSASGPHVTMGYDVNHNLTSVNEIDASGTVTRATAFGYDSSHQITTFEDPRQLALGGSGVSTTNTYSSNKVIEQSDNMVRNTFFCYGPITCTNAPGSPSVLSGSTMVVDPKSNVTVDTFTTASPSEPSSITRGYGTGDASITSYVYDPVTGGDAQVTDPNGNVTLTTYDQNGNVSSTLTEVTASPLTYRATITHWNNFHEPVETIDADGNMVFMTYDISGNLLTVSRPLNGTNSVSTTTTRYGDAGHPGDATSVIDPNGGVTQTTYNAYGQIAAETDALGNTATATFNSIGWKLTTISPRGNAQGALPSRYTTSYGLDGFGEVVSVSDPLHHTTSTTYDANGNAVTRTDANGNTTTNTYDADNELHIVTRPGGTTATTDYNSDGTVLDQKDGLTNTTTYGYDHLARRTTVADPDSRTTTTLYDPAGNVTSVTDPDHPTQPTTYTYDAGNEVTAVTSAATDRAPNVTQILYDPAGQRTCEVITSGTCGSHVGGQASSWTWDSLHRVTSSTDVNNALVCYGYDLKSEPTQLTYLPGATCPAVPGPSYDTVTRAYDAAGRLTGVTDWALHTTTFAYGADSSLTATTYPGSVTDTNGYDTADRLISMSDTNGTNFASFAYVRDPNGQLVNDTQTLSNQTPPADGYTYNTLNKLSGVTGTAATSYGSDSADNLTTNKGNAQTFDAAGQLCWTVSGASGNACASPPAGKTAYAYDQRGDRTSAVTSASAGTCETYDQASELTSYKVGTSSTCTSPTTSETYAYDGDGLRASKTAGSTTSTFVWDVSGSQPMLLRDGASSQTSYIYGPGGLPIEEITGGGTAYFFHHDQLGSTRALTNASGVVQTTWTYDAYGNAATVWPASPTVTTPLLFSGQYQDSESGLYYLRARYYDAATAQFMSRDPMVDSTMSPYAYVAGNPLNATDPSGLFGLGDIASAVSNVVHAGTKLATKVVSGAHALATQHNAGLQAAGTFFDDVAAGASVIAVSLTVAAAVCTGAAGAECGIPFLAVAGFFGTVSQVSLAAAIPFHAAAGWGGNAQGAGDAVGDAFALSTGRLFSDAFANIGGALAPTARALTNGIGDKLSGTAADVFRWILKHEVGYAALPSPGC